MSIDMIEEFIELSEERKAQKLRGLNNYNILTAVRNANAEVGMHSNFLSSLLKTDGDHYQGDLFAKLFIEHVLDIPDFGKKIEVDVEEATKDNRRIDFTIKSEKYYVGIEMKIDAGDQDKQISDYYDDLIKKVEKKSIKKDKVLIYYLTTHGKKASEASHQGKPYKQISFKKHIMNWLNEAQKQVSNITNLNNAIEYYRDVVKMITGKYVSPLYEYKDFFLDEKKGEERFLFFKYEEHKVLQECVDDYDQIARGFEDAVTILEQSFYRKLLEPILDDSLVFDEYINQTSGKQVRLLLSGQYHIRLHFNKAQTNIETIEFGVAWFNKKDNPEKNHDFNTIKHKVSTIEEFQRYINSKGVCLNKASIPKPTDENLFLSWRGNNIFQLDSQSEIREQHIKHIIETLKNHNLMERT